ncbi:MAG: flagellar biosynthesis protein FlhF [bacterium]|nr:flagellar biosynthesis protein FlhF [bacterium]
MNPYAPAGTQDSPVGGRSKEPYRAMKIKKFVGASMSECLRQVKKELGENAVILDSRKVPRGGPFSFLLNDMIEVTASTADRNLQGQGNSGRPGAIRNWGQAAETAQSSIQQALAAEVIQRTGTPQLAELNCLSDEIHELKETVYQMADHMKFSQLPSLPAELSRMHRDLLENGVDDRIVNTITQEITLELSGREFEDHKLLTRVLREKISKIAKTAPLMQEGVKPWVVALVGPTGVGKTTTLAKMATHPDIFGRKKVALVSVDTYRIAAVEQLKTFASIAGIPMEAVYRPADVRRAIDRFGDRDVILIDTAGRSQNDRGQLKDLAAFMDYAKPDEINLVLSISTRLEDQLDVIRKFKTAGAQRLLFTKLDETSNYGMILNICYHERKPVSLLTCGQNVPDDIIPPNQSQLVRLLCERSYFNDSLMPTAR